MPRRLVSGFKVIVGSGTVSETSPIRLSSSVTWIFLLPSVHSVRNFEADHYPAAGEDVVVVNHCSGCSVQFVLRRPL